MSARYELIDAEKANYPVVRMCDWLGVSTSGYYEWRARPASATAVRREALGRRVRQLFGASDGTYGYRRIHADLVAEHRVASLELVRSLMRELDLRPCQPAPYRPTTTVAGDDTAKVPDLVKRDFTAPRPGTKLVGDITYIRTWQGFVYLATVIDCYSRAVLGYAIADHMRADLVVAALTMAARNHSLETNAIFHSDRGSQYMSDDFARAAKALNIRRSVGRTGVCFDNALAESFNAAVKVERANRTVYPTKEHARRDIARYIEFRYNTRRRHSGLGYRTPQEALDEYHTNQAAA